MQNRQRISAQRLRQRPVDALVWNVSKLSYNNWKNWSRKIVRIRQSSYLKCFESRSNLWVIHSQIGVNGLFQIPIDLPMRMKIILQNILPIMKIGRENI